LAIADHQPLGEQLLKTGKPLDARREYRALLALQTQDPATAWLGLARAEAAAGNAPLARRHALQSLEIAPHFRPAQQFLLELRGEPAP
jgi:predicted Zn-dependent protease